MKLSPAADTISINDEQLDQFNQFLESNKDTANNALTQAGNQEDALRVNAQIIFGIKNIEQDLLNELLIIAAVRKQTKALEEANEQHKPANTVVEPTKPEQLDLGFLNPIVVKAMAQSISQNATAQIARHISDPLVRETFEEVLNPSQLTPIIRAATSNTAPAPAVLTSSNAIVQTMFDGAPMQEALRNAQAHPQDRAAQAQFHFGVAISEQVGVVISEKIGRRKIQINTGSLLLAMALTLRAAEPVFSSVLTVNHTPSQAQHPQRNNGPSLAEFPALFAADSKAGTSPTPAPRSGAGVRPDEQQELSFRGK